MKIAEFVHINASAEKVWAIISDIENAPGVIQGILKLRVLEPAKGPSIVGLKWEETRMFGGREATEVMWVTEAVENSHYRTRAESHGAVYESGMHIEPDGAGCNLTMTFTGEPQSFGAKVMWALTGWMAKNSVKKACSKDLADIKAAAEAE